MEDFFLLYSVRYRDDVMTTLKFNWCLKILMSGWYRKLTSPCVSFTIYQQCHGDIEGDFTSTSLQYQNVHWECTNQQISINFRKIVDSIVYVFLKILGWSSDETNICDFAGYCRMVYSRALAFIHDFSALSASTWYARND